MSHTSSHSAQTKLMSTSSTIPTHSENLMALHYVDWAEVVVNVKVYILLLFSSYCLAECIHI
jgi:hypothetical protein